MFGTLSNNFYISHSGMATAGDSGSDNSRSLSPRVWKDAVQLSQATDGLNNGMLVGDDFCLFQGLSGDVATSALAVPTITYGGLDGYKAYIDIGGKVTRLTTETGGIIQFDAGDTANDLAVIGSNNLLAVANSGANDRLTVFETRMKLTTVAAGSVFVGLGSATMVADGGLITDDGGPIAAGSAIGFSVDEADVDGIDFVYQAANQTAQNLFTAVDGATADAWYKLGFVYNPKAPSDKKIKVFVNNVEQSTYVTTKNIDADTFPEDEMLGFVAAAMTPDGTNSNTLEIDWWACYQAAN